MNLKTIFNDVNKSKDEKLEAVGEVRDSLDFASVKREEAIVIINELIELIINNEDNNIKESILGAMLDGYTSYDVEQEIDLEPIVNKIHIFNDECLGYVLTLLGWSGKEKYRELIVSFGDNKKLQEDVKEALAELNHRVKK